MSGKQIRHLFNPSSIRTTSELPEWLDGTLRHCNCWRRVLFVFLFFQHNGVFGWSSFSSHLQVVERCWWKGSIYLSSKDSIQLQLKIFARGFQCSPSLKARNRWYPYPELKHWQEPPPVFQLFIVGWRWLVFWSVDFLSLGQQQVPRWQGNFPRA